MRSIKTLIFALSFGRALFAADAYSRITDQMHDMQTADPDLVSVFSIGTDDSGRSIEAMRISLTPASADPSKIAHVMVATHHGNERHAPILAMHFARSLVVQYRQPRMLQGRLPDSEFVIVPVLNVSGYIAGTREERRLDPNRHYPGPCYSFTPVLSSIKAMIALLGSRSFASSVTVHGYLGSMTYPWGMATSDTRTADDSAYESLLKEAAKFNRYPYGTSTNLVYAAEGTYEDYAYWKHGAWSLLVELLDGSANDITSTTDALFTFFEQVNSSPSLNSAHLGRCTHSYSLDLHNE